MLPDAIHSTQSAAGRRDLDDLSLPGRRGSKTWVAALIRKLFRRSSSDGVAWKPRGSVVFGSVVPKIRLLAVKSTKAVMTSWKLHGYQFGITV